MALTQKTAALKSQKVFQASFIHELTIDLDASYPSGGYDLSADLKALTDHEILHAFGGHDGTNFYVYDIASKKLKAIVAATGVEVAGAVDLSGVVDLPITVWTQ